MTTKTQNINKIKTLIRRYGKDLGDGMYSLNFKIKYIKDPDKVRHAFYNSKIDSLVYGEEGMKSRNIKRLDETYISHLLSLMKQQTKNRKTKR
jgi:hypothetical protein